MTDNNLLTLVEQFETLIAYFQRPAVQWQLIAIIVAIILAAIVTLFAGYMARRRSSNQPPPASVEQPRTRRIFAFRYIIFPALVLIFMQVMVSIFNNALGIFGLIVASQQVFLLFLAYQIVITVLYIVFGEERVRPYHRRILLPVLVLVVTVAILGRLFDIGQLGEIRLINLFGLSLTTNRLLGFVLSLYFTLMIMGLIQDLMKTILLPRFDIDRGTTNAILTINRYVIIATGLIISLGALGLDLSTLALIGGGLSIGIGFGLQQIVANFLSGILLLFEQSLRPGDVIDIDGQLGRVETLSIRSTTVRTLENVEVVIPNETFLTSSVKNYTKSNSVVRFDIKVGVSYNSDPTEVRKILQDVITQHGRVLKNPVPQVYFVDFGASSLDFWIHFWIDDVMQRLVIATDIRMMIWKAFEKRGIEIPFPQQDLHLRSGFFPILDEEKQETKTVQETNQAHKHKEERHEEDLKQKDKPKLP